MQYYSYKLNYVRDIYKGALARVLLFWPMSG